MFKLVAVEDIVKYTGRGKTAGILLIVTENQESSPFYIFKYLLVSEYQYRTRYLGNPV